MKYRKLPVEIDAIQYQREENINEVQDFFGDGNGRVLLYDEPKNEYFIRTLEGDMYLTKGDWLIRSVNGEYYPCKPDIFEKTYEPVGKTNVSVLEQEISCWKARSEKVLDTME